MTIAMEAVLPCSCSAAFAAWSVGDELIRWWGDDRHYRLIAWESVLESGGRWRATFRAGEHLFSASGQYLEVSAPARLEWTWKSDWNPDTTDKITLSFVACEDSCLLRLSSIGYRSEIEKTQQEAGYRRVLSWVEEHFDSLRAPSRD